MHHPPRATGEPSWPLISASHLARSAASPVTPSTDTSGAVEWPATMLTTGSQVVAPVAEDGRSKLSLRSSLPAMAPPLPPRLETGLPTETALVRGWGAGCSKCLKEEASCRKGAPPPRNPGRSFASPRAHPGVRGARATPPAFGVAPPRKAGWVWGSVDGPARGPTRPQRPAPGTTTRASSISLRITRSSRHPRRGGVHASMLPIHRIALSSSPQRPSPIHPSSRTSQPIETRRAPIGAPPARMASARPLLQTLPRQDC